MLAELQRIWQDMILSEDPLNFVPSVLQLAREVLDVAAMMVKPGVTTEEIDHAVHLVRILHCGIRIFVLYH